MATMTVNTVLMRCNTLLKDPGFIRWTKQELLDYYNDAARAIVIVRPDAYCKNESFSCVAGTKQVLPAGALRLIEVIRNSDGPAIRNIPRKALDDADPNWHLSSTTVKVSAYIYDERDPHTFYLYPGPSAAHSIEVVYSVAPAIALLTEVDDAQSPAISDLDDIYINPLIDFILYRAYGKDSEYEANATKSTMHYNAFLQLLGDKTAVDERVASGKKQNQNPSQWA